MSQGTLSVFGPKINFLPKGTSMLFRQKGANFHMGIFHLFMSRGISACQKTPLGIMFK